MYKSQLLELFSTLTPADYASLKKFIASPYHYEGSQATNMLQLTDWIFAVAPDYEHPNLNKEKVYPAIYGKEIVVKGKLEKLMSETQKLVKDYLLISKTKVLNDPVFQQISLAGWYRRHKLHQRFKLALEAARRLTGEEQIHDKEHFYKLYLMNQEQFEFMHSYNDRRDDLNLSNTIHNLDVYFIISKLELTTNLITQGHFTTLEIERELNSLGDIIRWMRNEQFRDIPVIRMYDFVLQMFMEPERITPQDVLAFRQSIMDEQDSINPLLKRDFFAHSRNFCIRRFNAGETAFKRLIFDIFKEDQENGWLYNNGGITPATMQSIVICATRNGELAWLHHFLHEHRHKINQTDEPEKIYRHNLAHYYFYNHQYDEALDMLDSSYEDFYYLLTAKKLEIKIYYEMESDLVEFKIEAFKVFIYRQGNKILTPFIQAVNNAFVDMLRQIIHPSTYNNPQRIQRLIEKLESTKAIADREWLLQKLLDLNGE